MHENVRFYPAPLHGGGGCGLPADRETRVNPQKSAEERV